MGPIDKEKWHVRLSVTGIFVLGFIAGALALNLYRESAQGPMGPPPHRTFGRFLDNLDLNSDQRTKVDQIIADSRRQLMEVRRESEPKMSEITRETQDKLKAVLTPDQWEKFQDQLSQMRARHHHRPGGPGGPDDMGPGGPPFGGPSPTPANSPPH